MAQNPEESLHQFSGPGRISPQRGLDIIVVEFDKSGRNGKNKGAETRDKEF